MLIFLIYYFHITIIFYTPFWFIFVLIINMILITSAYPDVSFSTAICPDNWSRFGSICATDVPLRSWSVVSILVSSTRSHLTLIYLLITCAIYKLWIKVIMSSIIYCFKYCFKARCREPCILLCIRTPIIISLNIQIFIDFLKYRCSVKCPTMLTIDVLGKICIL